MNKGDNRNPDEENSDHYSIAVQYHLEAASHSDLR